MGAEIASDVASKAEETTTGLLNGVVNQLQIIFDTIFPPEKRAMWWEKVKGFASAHPKSAVSRQEADHSESRI
jgi:hypothetical protein